MDKVTKLHGQEKVKDNGGSGYGFGEWLWLRVFKVKVQFRVLFNDLHYKAAAGLHLLRLSYSVGDLLLTQANWNHSRGYLRCLQW
jgi:hypothetical protein